MKIKLKTVLLAFVILTTKIGFSQNLDWVNTTGGTGNDGGSHVQVDGMGNVVNSGLFTGTVDFDPGIGVTNLTASSGTNYFITKYNSSGDLLWAKQINGVVTLNEIHLNLTGDIFLTGGFEGTFDSDPGLSSANLVSAGSRDIFVIRLDGDNGNFIWSKRIGNTDFDEAKSITVDNLSNVILTGSFTSTVDFDPGTPVFNLSSITISDAFLLKLDANGDFSWALDIARGTTGFASANGLSLDTDDAMNIYVTGYHYGEVDLDPSTSSNQIYSALGAEDIFITKVSPSGVFNWARSIGSSGPERMLAIRNDYVNHIYLTGYFSGIVDFDPSASVSGLTSMGGTDISFLIMDLSGNFVFANNLGGTMNDQGLSVEAGYDGVFITGYYQDAYNYLTGNNFIEVRGGSGTGYNLFVEKTDFIGNHLWTRFVEGSGYEQGNKLAYSNNSELYVTGAFNSLCDMDPGILTDFRNTAGGNDIFLMKLICESQSNMTDDFCNFYTSPSGNHQWTTSGTYSDTIPNYYSCDSVITFNLTKLSNTGSAVINACNEFTSPSGSNTWTVSGTYMDTIQNINSCDSVLTLQVNIINIDTNVVVNWGSMYVSPQTGATYQWILCGSNTPVSGATTNFFVPTTNGIYAIEVTNGNCTITSGCHTYNTVGIDESEKNSFIVYPNPTSDNFYISFKESNKYKINLFDVSGKLVFSQNVDGNILKIDSSPFQTGIYQLQIENNNQIFNKKIIIK